MDQRYTMFIPNFVANEKLPSQSGATEVMAAPDN